MNLSHRDSELVRVNLGLVRVGLVTETSPGLMDEAEILSLGAQSQDELGMWVCVKDTVTFRVLFRSSTCGV